MDNGEEIPGLNEDWTFAGAKLMEWVSGFVMFMIVSEMAKLNPASSMPILLVVWLGTTLGLAALRKKYPDEERGVRNAVCVALGFAPPGVPAPASVMPYMSGAPLRKFKENSYFEQLRLAEALTAKRDTDIRADGQPYDVSGKMASRSLR
jgi:hypothetical protein